MFTPDDLQVSGSAAPALLRASGRPLPSPIPPMAPLPSSSTGPSSPLPPTSPPSPRFQQQREVQHLSHSHAMLPLTSSALSPPLICHPLDVPPTPPIEQELDCALEDSAADLDLTGDTRPLPSAEGRALDHMLTDPTAFESLASALDQSYSGELWAFWADLMWVVALPPQVSGWTVAPPIPSESGAFDPPRDDCLAHPSLHDWSILSPMARALSHTMSPSNVSSARNVSVTSLTSPSASSTNSTPATALYQGQSLSAPGTPNVGSVSVGGAGQCTKPASSTSVAASITRLLKRAWGSSSSSSSSRPHSPSPESWTSSRKGSASTMASSSPSPTLSLRQLNDDSPPWNGPSPVPSAASSTSTTSTAPAVSPSWFTRKLRPGASPVISVPSSPATPLSQPSSPAATTGPPDVVHESANKRRPTALHLSPPRVFDVSLGGPVDLPPLRSAPLGTTKLTLGAWPGTHSLPPTPVDGPPAHSSSSHARSQSAASLSASSKLGLPHVPPRPVDALGYSHLGAAHDTIARRIRYDLLRRYVHRGARCELNLTGDVHAHVVLEWERCTAGHMSGALAASCWDPLDLALTQVAREVRRMIRDSAAWTHIFHNPITFASESLSVQRSKPVMVRSAPESPRTVLERAILEAADPARSVSKRAAARTLSKSQRSQPSTSALLMVLEASNPASDPDAGAYGRTAPTSLAGSWLRR